MYKKLKPYIEIARPDHWFKNIFMLPGIVMAILLLRLPVDWNLAFNIIIGVFATCLIASANYVINEILDAEYDQHHPKKKKRPAASGRIIESLGAFEWFLLAFVGLTISYMIAYSFFTVNILFLIMGLIYNLPPMRIKDIPLFDIIAESINNPIRLSLGWFIVLPTIIPPLSALIAFWMLGAYFMTAKRIAERNHLNDLNLVRNYRKVLAWYTNEKLIMLLVFFSATFSYTFAIFAVRYKFEEIMLIIPVGALFAEYTRLTFLPDSPVQYPEKLYKQKNLFFLCLLSVILFFILLWVNIPFLKDMFAPNLLIRQ